MMADFGQYEAMASGLPGMIVGNSGEAIHLSSFPVDGIAAESTQAGQADSVFHRLVLTSDDSLFHQVVPKLSRLIEERAQQAGASVRISRAGMVLLVIHEDDLAEAWVDAAAVAMSCLVKRPIDAGSVVMSNDIADILAVHFPCVSIGPEDRVICIFQQDWRYGFYADFNPARALDLNLFSSTLGALHRNLAYRHLYDVVNDKAMTEKLEVSGWFPFVEIVSGEYAELAEWYKAGFPLEEGEARLIERFSDARIDAILRRWLSKPDFASREKLLVAATAAFKAREPVSVIKIILTEIEGVLNEAHKATNGKGAKLQELLRFAMRTAESKVGAPDTLIFSAAFGAYLRGRTFGDFDPATSNGKAGSRHAVGHGAASAESYTMARALQALLTLDQLAFYV